MNIPLTGTAAEDENIAKFVASNIEMTTLLDIARVETDITNMRLIVRPDARKMESRGIDIDEVVDRLNKVKAVRGLVTRDGYDVVITSDEPSYKKLQTMFDAIKGAKIKGIDNITRAVLSKTEGSWKIVTEGSNLKEVLKVEGVDADNVMTNSILEVERSEGTECLGRSPRFSPGRLSRSPPRTSCTPRWWERWTTLRESPRTSSSDSRSHSVPVR